MEKDKDKGPVPGGGPREGEEAKVAVNPNPEAVHPDFQQATPAAPAPPSTVEEGTAEDKEADDEA